MKKFIIVIFAMVMSLLPTDVFAQTHPMVDGVPLGQSMSSFCQSLIQKGWTIDEYNNRATSINGYFLSVPVSAIVAADEEGVVKVVIIHYHYKNITWQDLETTYSLFKYFMINDFGQPVKSTELFTNGYNRQTGMYALYNDGCMFSSRFLTTTAAAALDICAAPAPHVALHISDISDTPGKNIWENE